MQIVTQRQKAANEITVKLKELVETAEQEELIGLACVLIKKDGAVLISTHTSGNRTLLLGAVTDLQFTIARYGDGY